MIARVLALILCALSFLLFPLANVALIIAALILPSTR